MKAGAKKTGVAKKGKGKVVAKRGRKSAQGAKNVKGSKQTQKKKVGKKSMNDKKAVMNKTKNSRMGAAKGGAKK